MIRYSRIDRGFRREFVLLQGLGCRWRKCTFCDYHLDTSGDPYEVNRAVLELVSGDFGVLDVINSGSAMELDRRTVDLIASIVVEKGIQDLWFEAHWMYRNRLSDFASRFPCRVHFRTGVESFSGQLRTAWRKGIGEDVTPQEVRRYFEGVCLLVGVEGQSREDVLSSIRIAEDSFDYYSVNLFCPNSTSVRRDEELSRWAEATLPGLLAQSAKAELLLENTDLGVG